MTQEKKIICLEKVLGFLFIALLALLLFENMVNLYQISNSETMSFRNQKNSFNSQIPINKKGSITLELDSNVLYPNLEILINGEVIGYFGNTKLLVLDVRDKDVVTINASMYSEPISITVFNITDNIQESIKDKRFLAEKLTLIGIIRLT